MGIGDRQQTTSVKTGKKKKQMKENKTNYVYILMSILNVLQQISLLSWLSQPVGPMVTKKMQKQMRISGFFSPSNLTPIFVQI